MSPFYVNRFVVFKSFESPEAHKDLKMLLVMPNFFSVGRHYSGITEKVLHDPCMLMNRSQAGRICHLKNAEL